ncbi:MAG: 4Fe-4S binding protein [Candidatus Lindowbacteria bacterium]|nr:4Fe-4S binding protein [Candidatus Lindowbacteria bacterium]
MTHRYPLVDKDLCIGCGACHGCCPAEPNVFEIEFDTERGEDKSSVVTPEACIECELCVTQCPVQAISLTG